eukprot:TRINITY_DN459_c0_g1_i2.p2 TRINITY_DN459_c0_g1~~TRINITY_DN459_c0_g1_i2.p2  ORF type:complete len:275 (+),score=50.99 TRINITY_DN459_c0_g1_i2:122-946(+)
MAMAQNETDLFNGVQMNPMTAWVAKQAAIKLTLAPLAKGRVQIQEAVTQPCKMWAKYCRRPLVTEDDYPEGMRSWPLICLGMLKSKAFRDEPIVKPDIRSALFFHIWTCSTSSVDLLFRPTLYPIHELLHDTSLGVWDEDETAVSLPVELGATMSQVMPDGLYLLDDANTLVLWIGEQLDSSVVDQLFAPATPHQLFELLPQPEQDDGSLLARVWNVIEFLRSMCPGRSQQLVCCSSTSAEAGEFTFRLYEDRTKHVMNYTEFMDHLREISSHS